MTRLGLAAAMRVLVLSEPMDAAEMLRVGFLGELVSTPEALAERIEKIAGTLVAMPVPAVTVAMKRALNRIAHGDLDSAVTDAAWAASIGSPTVALAAAERLAERRQAAKELSRG